MTEEQVTKAFAEAASDVKFLLDKEGVDKMTQARLYDAGVLNVKQFAALFKDAEDYGKLRRRAWGLTGARG